MVINLVQTFGVSILSGPPPLGPRIALWLSLAWYTGPTLELSGYKGEREDPWPWRSHPRVNYSSGYRCTLLWALYPAPKLLFYVGLSCLLSYILDDSQSGKYLTQCSLLSCCFRFQDRKVRRANKRQANTLARLTLRLWRQRKYVLPKRH
jgi:hypothetical protein